VSAFRNRKYPEYKDSGRQWLKEIPSHWSTPKFGQVFRERRTKVSDKDFDALSVTKEGIVPQLANAAKTDHGDNRKLVLNGDFVINSRSDRKGSSGVSRLNGSVSTISIVLEILKGNNRYIHHLLRSHDFKEEFYRLGHGIVADLWSTRFDDIKGELLCFPPENEQEQISDFLDFADKAIVDLVKDLERLLGILKEKRSTIITQAVTKGLNSNVSMKHSDIDWIGEIPEHWTIKRIKHIGKLRGGAGFPDQEQGLTDEEIPFHKVNALGSASSRGLIVENTNTISPETASRLGAYVFPKDTIVFAKVGAALLLKRFCLLSEPSCIDNNMMGFIVDESKENVAFIQNSLANISFDKIVNPGAVPSVNGSQIGAIPLAIPPRSEQNKIMEFLLIKTTFFDNVKIMLSRKIDLLKEYKTALISAAVTGKIDVRGQA
jgi:type I restriction enzyme, S subunit